MAKVRDPYATIASLASRVALRLQKHELVIRAGPREGSLALSAAQDPDRLSQRTAQLAGNSLGSSLDHFRLHVDVVCAGRVHPFAWASVLRTAHETALVAGWLMDRDIEENERTGRAVGAQFNDYIERRKFENASQAQPPEGGALASERLDDMMQLAMRRGLAFETDKGRLAPAHPLPTIVSLFNKFETHTSSSGHRVPGEVYYRMYSSFAHGKQWALLISEMEPVLGDGPDSVPTAIAATASDELIVGLTALAFEATGRALDAFAAYHLPADGTNLS